MDYQYSPDPDYNNDAKWERVVAAMDKACDRCRTPEDAAGLLASVFGDQAALDMITDILCGDSGKIDEALERWYDKEMAP